MRIPIATLAVLLLAVSTLSGEEAAAEKPTPQPLAEIPKSPAGEKEQKGLELWTWSGEGPSGTVQGAKLPIKEQPGNIVIKLDYLGTRSEKVGAKCLTDLYLADEGKLTCRFYSAEKNPPRVAFALCAGDQYTWQESEPQPLKEGWNEVELSFSAKKWKSAASNWKYEAELQNRNDIRAVHLLIFNGRQAGELYLDALQLERDQKFCKRMEELAKKLGDENFEAREAAEKELLEAGRKALEFLREAAAGPEAEVAQRAKRIIEKIEKPASSATAEAEREAGEQKRVRKKIEQE